LVSFFVAPKDTTSHALDEKITTLYGGGAVFAFIAPQGTGVFSIPISRLKYDFQRLGRFTTAAVINCRFSPLIKPALVSSACQVHTHQPPQVLYEFT
jgi:hypothetical protein